MKKPLQRPEMADARSLQALAGACQGNDRPDCPILDDLAG